MEIKILEEAGHDTALYGFSLSYKDRAVKPEDWWFSQDHNNPYYPDIMRRRFDKIPKTAKANAPRGKGHNKFLRQIMLWVDIEAPRYWWSEFDTYKVGTVAQSESTMHTIMKRDVVPDDFEEYDDGLLPCISQVNMAISYKEFYKAKRRLPEAYLQRRVVTMNYEVLRTIIKQRKGHRLPEWATFIGAVAEQVEHPEYIEDLL